MTIKESIMRIVEGMVKPDLHIGTVVSVNTDNMTCEIDPVVGANIEPVRLRAVINEVAKGFLITPKIGSTVVFARIDGKIESSVVLAYSEIEEFNGVTEGVFKVNGDNDGGMVKIEPLDANLDAIKSYLDAMKSAIFSGLNAVGAGAAANGAAGAQVFNNAMTGQVITFENMESEKNFHGDGTGSNG